MTLDEARVFYQEAKEMRSFYQKMAGPHASLQAASDQFSSRGQGVINDLSYTMCSMGDQLSAFLGSLEDEFGSKIWLTC